jgi:hypothetical protein
MAAALKCKEQRENDGGGVARDEAEGPRWWEADISGVPTILFAVRQEPSCLSFRKRTFLTLPRPIFEEIKGAVIVAL